MPSITQEQILKDQMMIQSSINVNEMIKDLWNSLQFSLDHIDATETRGVTWINDYQFIINIRIFSKYINMKKETIIINLSNQGFLNLGSPSKEILNDFDILSSEEWLLYMKQQFTPNSEIDFD